MYEIVDMRHRTILWRKTSEKLVKLCSQKFFHEVYLQEAERHNRIAMKKLLFQKRLLYKIKISYNFL